MPSNNFCSYTQKPKKWNTTSKQMLTDTNTYNDNKRISLYKTEMCRSFEETGTCKYESKCQFAHKQTELRELDRHFKYKTKECRKFSNGGFCPYGKRCVFIHRENQEKEFNLFHSEILISIKSLLEES